MCFNFLLVLDNIVKKSLKNNLLFQKISMLTPWRVSGNCEGKEVTKMFCRKSMREERFKPKNLPWVECGYFLEQHNIICLAINTQGL